MKVRGKEWLWRSIVCFIKGHEDVMALYNPVTGSRDMGFVCARYGRPRIQTAAWLMSNYPKQEAK